MRVMIIGRYYPQSLETSNLPSLLSAAKSLGINVVRSLDDAPDVLICVDYSRANFRVIRRARRRGLRTVLVIQEPQVILPQHSKPSILRNFDLVLRVGRPHEVPLLKWPQSWRTVFKNPTRIKSAVMINSDKWSFVRGHLYWLRAALASQSENLVVFGYGWERSNAYRLSLRLVDLFRILSTMTLPSLEGIGNVLSRPLSYRGKTADKVAQMSDYAVAVVIENSTEFVSEKLFDAWFAGCVPVYVGPSIESMGLPSELVIPSNPDIRSLKEAIEQAHLVDRVKFLVELEKFLSTKQALEWKSEIALETILRTAIEANNAK